MELADVRAGIDRVDSQIKELFLERMQLADQVAQVKALTQDEILKPEREAAIIEKRAGDVEPSFRKQYIALIRKIMGVSREYQYGRTLELRGCPDFPECPDVLPEHNRLRFQFACPDHSGALAGVLAVIGDYGFNLTMIQTVPAETEEHQLECDIEIAANLLEQDTRAMIFQLSKETESFRIVGSRTV